MDTELLAITDILVVAGWIALMIRGSKMEPVVVPLTKADDSKET